MAIVVVICSKVLIIIDANEEEATHRAVDEALEHMDATNWESLNGQV